MDRYFVPVVVNSLHSHINQEQPNRETPMQFTPQQLAGAGRFNSKTRIGNWNEDTILEEYRMKEYRLRKTQGQLSSFSQQKKFLLSQAPVPLTCARPDLLVKYGDYLQLQHEQSSATLACDLWEETETGSGDYMVSIAPTTTTNGNPPAMARNTFKLMPIDPDQMGQVVNYGDAFRLMCNESLRIDETNQVLKPMTYLTSRLKSERLASPISGHQLVCASSACDASTIWRAAKASVGGSERYLATGTPLFSQEPLSLLHQMTGQALHGDSRVSLATDFGLELEICCFSSRTPGKCHNLQSEREGSRTIDSLSRSALSQNTWRVIQSQDAESGVDSRKLPEVPTARRILSLIQRELAGNVLALVGQLEHMVLASGGAGVSSSSPQLDREDVKWALKDFGIQDLTDEHLDLFLDALDEQHNGLIPLTRMKEALTVSSTDS